MKEYEQMSNEPEIKVIQDELAKLAQKYNFKCDILMDGLYSNQKYTLYESHYEGPYKVVSTEPSFSFLENKIYAKISDIEKELLKEKIKILSNCNADNFSFINSHYIAPIFKCAKCNCVDAPINNSNGSNKSSSLFSFKKDNFEHKQLDFYENKAIPDDVILNNFSFQQCEIYECRNCSKELVPDTQREMFYRINYAKIHPTLLNITNSGGGSISIIREYAKIVKA
jgi:hypothetical protein